MLLLLADCGAVKYFVPMCLPQHFDNVAAMLLWVFIKQNTNTYVCGTVFLKLPTLRRVLTRCDRRLTMIKLPFHTRRCTIPTNASGRLPVYPCQSTYTLVTPT